MKKQIKFIMCFLMVTLITCFVSLIYAEEKPTIKMDISGDFYINEMQEFNISTTVPEGYESVTVVGDGGISDTSAIEKLEYYEVQNGNWYTLPKDTAFGGSNGFELANATSRFRVTFNKAGNYTVRYAVKSLETNEVIAENTMTISVKDRSTTDVSNEQEFLTALGNSQITTINITKDITTTSKINITRDVTINGNSHKITLNTQDNKVWGGHYVLQAYRCNVTISDITLTGGNAALLVNGSNVKLIGTIDVSGNEFGGIELAKSASNPTIDLTEARLVNSSEAYLKPTLWTDPVLEGVSIDYDGFVNSIQINMGDHLQTQYYLVLANTVDTIDNQLKKQMTEGNSKIELNSNGNDKISKELLNELKMGENKTIVIYQDNAMLTFETKNITENFKEDLDLSINITNKQPFRSEVLKDTKGKTLFIEIAYDGALPKDTEIMVKLGDFKAGEKSYLYYYNDSKDELELVSEKVEITDENWAVLVLNHSSTYVLSTTKIDNVKSGVEITNPNTSDIYMFIALALGVIAIIGFAYVIKLKRASDR